MVNLGGAEHGEQAQRHQHDRQAFLHDAVPREKHDQRGGHETQQRRHAFARQPGTAPLRKGAPGPFLAAQMQRGAEQAGDHEHGAQAEADVILDAEIAVVAEQRTGPPEPQAVTGAGQRAEENDR